MKHGRAYTIGFMVGLSCLFGAAIAGLSILSKPAIEKNERLLEQRAYVSVFQLGDVGELSNDEVLSLVDRFVEVVPENELPVDPETGQRFPVLRAYEDEARTSLKSIAFKFRGLGFWAPIEGWLALTPDRARTVGLVITRQSETPGLGGRVTEPIFTDPFAQGILVSAPEQADARFIQVSANRPPDGTELAERHVDAITGATQTCMAMETILDDSLRAFTRAWRNSDAGQTPAVASAVANPTEPSRN